MGLRTKINVTQPRNVLKIDFLFLLPARFRINRVVNCALRYNCFLAPGTAGTRPGVVGIDPDDWLVFLTNTM